MEWNIADLFEAVADTVPDRIALVAGRTRLTFAELDARANRLAHGLADLGIGAGNHVGCYLHNDAEHVETMLAAYKLRAVPINVNYRYVDDELAYLFADAGLAALVYGAEFRPHVVAVVPAIATVRVLVEVTVPGAPPAPANVAPLPGTLDYEALLAASSDSRTGGPRSGDDRYVL